MRTIWKYDFTVNDHVIIEMPKGAEILTVQMCRDTPCIWALVNPEAEKEECHFDIYGTGFPVYLSLDHWYIGTFQMHDGDLVFHLFGKLIKNK